MVPCKNSAPRRYVPGLNFHHRPTWVEGTTALLGDACHPMLPYVAQGAAQAMEDGIVLSVVLSAIRDRSQVNEALIRYEVRETHSTCHTPIHSHTESP